MRNKESISKCYRNHNFWSLKKYSDRKEGSLLCRRFVILISDLRRTRILRCVIFCQWGDIPELSVRQHELYAPVSFFSKKRKKQKPIEDWAPLTFPLIIQSKIRFSLILFSEHTQLFYLKEIRQFEDMERLCFVLYSGFPVSMAHLFWSSVGILVSSQYRATLLNRPLGDGPYWYVSIFIGGLVETTFHPRRAANYLIVVRCTDFLAVLTNGS